MDACEKATGGGAYKYADLFKQRLGITLDKEDEMDCLVAGANFLLKVEVPFYTAFIMYQIISVFGACNLLNAEELLLDHRYWLHSFSFLY